MAKIARAIRTRGSLISAFRAAAAKKDSKKSMSLRDESGDRLISGRRASARALVSEREMQEQIQIDLTQLLNTINLASTQDLEGYDEVPRSIINYGIPDIVHRTIDEASVDEVVGELEMALKRFEPRIIARSIDVRRDMGIDKTELKVRFVVSAEISMEPENLPVEFVADVDVENSKFVINRI